MAQNEKFLQFVEQVGKLGQELSDVSLAQTESWTLRPYDVSGLGFSAKVGLPLFAKTEDIMLNSMNLSYSIEGGRDADNVDFNQRVYRLRGTLLLPGAVLGFKDETGEFIPSPLYTLPQLAQMTQASIQMNYRGNPAKGTFLLDNVGVNEAEQPNSLHAFLLAKGWVQRKSVDASRIGVEITPQSDVRSSTVWSLHSNGKPISLASVTLAPNVSNREDANHDQDVENLHDAWVEHFERIGMEAATDQKLSLGWNNNWCGTYLFTSNNGDTRVQGRECRFFNVEASIGFDPGSGRSLGTRTFQVGAFGGSAPNAAPQDAVAAAPAGAPSAENF